MSESKTSSSLKIGINGFGRIGRLVTRVTCGKEGVEVAAINGEHPTPAWDLVAVPWTFMTLVDCCWCFAARSVHGVGLHGLPAQVRQRAWAFQV